MKRTIIAAVVLALLSGHALAQVKQREVLDQDVDRAIKEAVRYLLVTRNSDGHWLYENTGVPRGIGHTAVALFALLEAGEEAGIDPQNDDMKKALDWLSEQKSNHTYVVACRTLILSAMYHKNPQMPYVDTLKADIEILCKDAAKFGAWGYGGAEKDGDNSASQLALLALAEADNAGMEIKTDVFNKVQATWVSRQQKDGGWRYAGQTDAKQDSTPSMTAAALASLYLLQDRLSAGVGANPLQDKVDKGWKCLQEKLPDDFYKDGYLAFAIQRLGMTSGEKFIGKKDWFALGAGKLAEPVPSGRRYDGQYGPIVEASFELIFLARSRLPMTFNKLDYGAPAQWNAYPRDLARFTVHMDRAFERRMRWQVVQMADDIRLMTDAPVLLIEGNAALKFNDSEWAKLREYTLRGGTILMIPNGENKDFIASAQKALGDLYADLNKVTPKYYKLEMLPDSHPIYSKQTHLPIDSGSTRFPIQAISDGTRPLVLLSHKDLAQAWLTRWPKGTLDKRPDAYKLSENIYFYATSGSTKPLSRMRPVFVAAPGEAKYTAKVAWLEHGGNWNTQPFALKYLGEKLVAENKMNVEIKEGAAINAKGLEGADLAWMTGTDEFTLTDAQIKALQDYIDGGGTLFVNAVGGSRNFRESAQKMIEKIIEVRAGVTSATATLQSSVYSGKCGDFRGPLITDLKDSRSKAWSASASDRGLKGPAVEMYDQNGRTIIMYCPFGLHDTLDGHVSLGAVSYLPAFSRDIAANVVLTAMMKKPAAATVSAPAEK